jgi:fructose-1-phosphate kinase PfkB-like protein
MLFGLGLGGSLLAGFGMAATKTPSWVHMVIFAAAMAVALFVVTDLEYPRLGLVRVDSFDHFTKALYDQMQ